MGGEKTSRPAPFVFTVVGRALVSVTDVVIGSCFVLVLVWLVCFLREKQVGSYFLQNSQYISVDNKEEIFNSKKIMYI